jgi:hypothetical protein
MSTLLRVVSSLCPLRSLYTYRAIKNYEIYCNLCVTFVTFRAQTLIFSLFKDVLYSYLQMLLKRLNKFLL